MNNWNAKIERWNGKIIFKRRIPAKMFYMVVPEFHQGNARCAHSKWKCTNLKMSSPLKFLKVHPALVDCQEFLESRGRVIFAHSELVLLHCFAASILWNLNSTFFHSLFWNAVRCSEQLIKGSDEWTQIYCLPDICRMCPLWNLLPPL